MQDRQNNFEELAPAVSVREYADILRRRRPVILQTLVLVLVVGVAVTLMSPPTYRATARMLVEAPSYNLNTVDTSNPLSPLLAVAQQYSIETQVELLQSAGIRKKVAEKLGGSLPDFTVEAKKDTEIIEVTAEGSRPRLVANAANALLDTYIDDVAGAGGKELRKAREFTEGGAKRAQTELEATEMSLRRFKQRHNVVELDKNRDAQLAVVQNLETQYQEAQSELAAVRARLAATKSRAAREPKTRAEIVSAAADPALQALDAQIAGLEAQRAGLLQEYKPVHARVAAVDGQIAVLRRRLAGQRASVAARTERINPAYEALQERLVQLEMEASGLRARTAATARRLADARDRLAGFASWESELSRLQRRLETARTSYENFSRQREHLRLREQTRRASAHVIERADTPRSPVRPRKLQNIVVAALLGVFFGLCLALLQEFLDDRINSPDEAGRILRLPSLGHVPAIEERGLRLIRDLAAFSPVTEAYRGLRAGLSFAAVDNPVRTLLITSSGPGEGKSTTIANLAMALALDGKRVIVVDADLRRPTLHALFGLAPSPGLTDLLVGTQTLREVIRPTGVDGVSVLPAGSLPPNPAELLGSEAMAHFVDAARALADVVLIDSPPVLAVADAVLLSSRVDGVLFVIGCGETKKTNARQALELLARARARVLGTVFNKLDSPEQDCLYRRYYAPVLEPVRPATLEKE